MMEAGKIVSYVKKARNDIYDFTEEKHIDFLGCSEIYVVEKVDALIFALKDLKRHCKAVDKRQDSK